MTATPDQSRRLRISPRVLDAAGLLLFCGVVAVMSWRLAAIRHIPGDLALSTEQGRCGLNDFRDAIYYPIRAAGDGVNPYDCNVTARPDGRPRYQQTYPVGNIFPLYSPLILLVYAPFALPSFEWAALLYVIFNLLLLVLLAYLLLRCAGVQASVGMVALLASLLLISQPGRANFIAGQPALLLTLASLGAVYYAERNVSLSVLCLTLALLKPTFGLPVAALLLARRNFSSVLGGCLISGALAVIGLVLIFGRSGDLGQIPQLLLGNQQALEADPDVNPTLTSSRIDLPSAIQRMVGFQGHQGGFTILVGGLLVAATGAVLWRSSACPRTAERFSLENQLILAVTSCCIYHLIYDGLLLALPLVCSLAALTRPPKTTPPETMPQKTGNHRWRRWAVALAFLIPFVHALGSQSALRMAAAWRLAEMPLMEKFAGIAWILVCIANAWAILAGLLLLSASVATCCPNET